MYSPNALVEKSNRRNLPEKIVIGRKKICSSSRPRTSTIDPSLNHVSYNTSRIKTVQILTLQENYVPRQKRERERNKKPHDSSNAGIIAQAINMISGFEFKFQGCR